MPLPQSTPEDLRRSEIRYRRLFEAARDGILILNAFSLKITDSNPYMTELLGYSEADFLGRELWEIGFFSDKEASMTVFEKLQETGYVRYDDLPLKTSDGGLRQVDFVSNVYDEDGTKVIQCNIRDITERKDLESRNAAIQERLPDGSQRTVQAMAELILDSKTGNPLKLLGSFQDITGRKRSEDVLRESQEGYRDLVENATDIIYTHDLKGNFTSVNKAAEETIGFTREEAKSLNVSQFVAPEYRERSAQIIADRLAGKIIPPFEMEILAKDGHRVAVEVNTRIIYEGGAPVGVQGIARDITDRKRAQAASRESEEKFHQLADTVSDVFFITSADMQRIHYVSPAYEQVWGRTTESLYANPSQWGEAIILEDRKNAIESFRRLAAGGSSVGAEFRIERPDGELRWIFSRGSHVRDETGTITRIAGIASDITERKRTDAELQDSHRRVEDIVNSVDGIVWEADAQTFIFTFVSLQAERILGYPSQRWVDEPTFWSDHIHPDDRDVAVKFCVDSTNKLLPHEFEYRMLAQDGRDVWIKDTVTVLAEGGRPIKLRGIMMDITERKAADEALRESDEKFHQLADHIADAFWIRSPDMSKIYYLSPAYEKICARPLQTEYANPDEWYDFIFPQDRQSVRDAYAALISDVSRIEIEYRVVRPSGEQRWVRSRGFQVKGPTGEVIRLAGVITDITEKKETEKEIELTLQRLNDAQRLGKIGDWGWDIETEIITWSPEVFEIIGRDPLLGPPANFEEQGKAYDPASWTLQKEKVAIALESGEPQEFELVVVRPDGQLVFVHAMCEPRKDADGKVLGLSGTIQDISSRKQAEDDLSASELRYRSLFNSMLEGYAYCDTLFEGDELRDFIYVEVNGAFEKHTGLTDVTGKKVSEVLPDLARSSPELFEIYGRVALTGDPEKFEMYIDPLAQWLSITVYSADRGHFVAVFDNITERKQADRALHESEDRYRTLFETSPDGVAMFDLAMNVLVANSRSAQLFGYATADEMVGKNAFDLVAPENLDRSRDNIRSMIESGYLPALESIGMRADRTKFAVEFSATLIRNSDGSPQAVLGVTRDITERKLAEEKLRSSEENLAKSQEIAHLGSWSLAIPAAGDISEGQLYWSDEVFRIFGYLPREIEVSNELFFNAVHPDDRAVVADAMAKALVEGSEFRIDHRILLPDGSERFVHEHSEIVTDIESGETLRMVGTIQDISDRHGAERAMQAVEDQLRQAQKMEAVGVLAGGVAHDFNNLLTAINGYSDLTLRAITPDDPIRVNIEEIRKAGGRAAELTAQLLAFSRKQVLKAVVVNLNLVISNIEKMLRRILRENIELIVVLDQDLGNIRADPGQIEQVVMNLAVNARDAMPSGGRLTIETRNVHLDESYLSQHIAVAAGDFVKMTITDNGEGIDAITQTHVFEPFFTTKEVGKGTGLGLSTVYGIVKQSGGDVMIYSEPGHGTTIKIYLPCVDEIAHKPRWTEDTVAILTGTETILVVEDEDMVRNLVSEVLTTCGYKVLLAESGKAGLAVCTTYPDLIHLMLTDVIMPKMGGGELKAEVLKLRPGIKVLLMSGYTDNSIADQGIIAGETFFIEKPFTPDALARKVREVLE